MEKESLEKLTIRNFAIFLLKILSCYWSLWIEKQME